MPLSDSARPAAYSALIPVVLALLLSVGVLAGCGGITPTSAGAPVMVEGAAERESTDEEPPGRRNQDAADPVESCEPEVIGEEAGPVLTIHSVVDGELGPVCFGEESEVLDGAWEILAGFAPAAERSELDLFAGYLDEADTLAFAGPVGETNDRFMVAVGLEAASADPQELRLTMAHEFAHVFTQTPDQLDMDIGPGACPTYWNGLGCLERDSYVAQWIEQFWTEEELSSLPLDGSIDEEGGEDRCLLDPTFLGTYAASHPEEDFAETFSTFVFDLSVDEAVEDKVQFFHGFPELVVYRDTAQGTGEEPPPDNFDRCG